jgi:hypothetical protein
MRLIGLAALRFEFPSLQSWEPWAQGGALFSYGPDVNLLVSEPTKFELLINLKTAKAWADDTVHAAAAR